MLTNSLYSNTSAKVKTKKRNPIAEIASYLRVNCYLLETNKKISTFKHAYLKNSIQSINIQHITKVQ